jgi:hypothetical protein
MSPSNRKFLVGVAKVVALGTLTLVVTFIMSALAKSVSTRALDRLAPTQHLQFHDRDGHASGTLDAAQVENQGAGTDAPDPRQEQPCWHPGLARNIGIAELRRHPRHARP